MGSNEPLYRSMGMEVGVRVNWNQWRIIAGLSGAVAVAASERLCYWLVPSFETSDPWVVVLCSLLIGLLWWYVFPQVMAEPEQ